MNGIKLVAAKDVTVGMAVVEKDGAVLEVVRTEGVGDCLGSHNKAPFTPCAFPLYRITCSTIGAAPCAFPLYRITYSTTGAAPAPCFLIDAETRVRVLETA
jgi:hypothetical protein